MNDTLSLVKNVRVRQNLMEVEFLTRSRALSESLVTELEADIAKTKLQIDLFDVQLTHLRTLEDPNGLTP